MALFQPFKSDGVGVGSLGKMFSSFMNPERAYRRAGERADTYYNKSQEQMQPYIEQGQNAYGGLNTAMQSLLNPVQLHNEWASQYETSPYAKLNMELAQNQGLDAASSMGLMGSSPALRAIQAGTSRIGMADREHWLDGMMQKYLSGAQLAQGLYGQGANMAGLGAQNTMAHGGTMGQTAYGQAAAPGAVAGNLLGMLIAAKTGGMAGGLPNQTGASSYPAGIK